ncbi:MAG: hypothetical protein K5930_12645 [Treponemataceae bacterium]|nr:hypothetical protein [Treponemataceae bacterium]
MKRIICFIVALSCFAAVSAAVDFDFTWALGSSATFYGDSEFSNQIEEIKDAGNKNIVLSGELGLRLGFVKNLYFCLNAVVSADLLTSIVVNYFFLDYGISGGFKLYTGLGGLCLGVEYETGRRTNIMPEEGVHSTGWGNGFRFLIEYEFKNIAKSFSPSFGLGWKRMPRGNNYADNIISFYVRAPF